MEPNKSSDEGQERKQPEAPQWVNLHALRWAYKQKGLGVTAKAVLMSMAIHANERGYTWPGVEHIASTWGFDETTVRRQIKTLLVRHRIRATRKRIGKTRQVKVYRMPKSAYERRAQCTPLEKTKGGRKAGESRAQCPQNNDNDEQLSHQNDSTLCGTSTPTAPEKRKAELDFGVEDHQYQNQPAQDHIKWPEFAEWCRRKGGEPHEAGFWKWLNGQDPRWKNRVKTSDGTPGYTLNGKFFTPEQANRLGMDKPELLTEFRPAVKHNGKIQICLTSA